MICIVELKNFNSFLPEKIKMKTENLLSGIVYEITIFEYCINTLYQITSIVICMK